MRRRGESGQVLPLVAICLAGLMGFGGMAVDVGYWRYQQREQQSATDAAALGGAQQLLYSGCPNSGAASTFSGDACAVSVQITKQRVASFFTRLFGKAAGINESTQAVATLSATGGGCIYLLSMRTSSNFNGST